MIWCYHLSKCLGWCPTQQVDKIITLLLLFAVWCCGLMRLDEAEETRSGKSKQQAMNEIVEKLYNYVCNFLSLLLLSFLGEHLSFGKSWNNSRHKTPKAQQKKEVKERHTFIICCVSLSLYLSFFCCCQFHLINDNLLHSTSPAWSSRFVGHASRNKWLKMKSKTLRRKKKKIHYVKSLNELNEWKTEN